ncbi:hypothetical protein AVEN_208685-1 [Araneus ventricosus]|uniref:Uncharacterized protein n=1 Tax=Araneus ventricosus TaxID=182803 RepID=A0A4Y2MXS8_ARAVE|nr:hypothetical protein AVEN_208685-1 [Araneus ventricosus]
MRSRRVCKGSRFSWEFNNGGVLLPPPVIVRTSYGRVRPCLVKATKTPASVLQLLQRLLPGQDRAMECDRYGVSDRTATLFASAVLQDIGIVHEGEASHVVDRNKIRRPA